MENSICLDTDFLVDFLRNKSEAVDWMKEKKDTSELATTIINIFELYYGAFKQSSEKELESIEILKKNLKILEFDLVSAKNAAKTKAFLEEEGNMLEFRDILIGSISLSNGFSMKTNNKKHFERIRGLRLI